MSMITIDAMTVRRIAVSAMTASTTTASTITVSTIAVSVIMVGMIRHDGRLTRHPTAENNTGMAEKKNSQRQPRLGTTRAASTISNKAPQAQNVCTTTTCMAVNGNRAKLARVDVGGGGDGRKGT